MHPTFSKRASPCRGGLGLTTGICDVGSLIDCLYGINSGLADLDILKKYNELRRQIFNEVVDVTSTANFRRVMQTADDFIRNDPAYNMILAASTDSNVAAAVKSVSALVPYFVPRLWDSTHVLKRDMAIGSDLTQFYHIPEIQVSAKIAA
jgi:2-polyprenyl-6-methoxyphenol hydroxylase-like FAD-dependent oxidoreductase